MQIIDPEKIRRYQYRQRRIRRWVARYKYAVTLIALIVAILSSVSTLAQAIPPTTFILSIISLVSAVLALVAFFLPNPPSLSAEEQAAQDMLDGIL